MSESNVDKYIALRAKAVIARKRLSDMQAEIGHAALVLERPYRVRLENARYGIESHWTGKSPTINMAKWPSAEGDVSRLVLRDTMGLLCAGLVVGSFLVVWGRSLAASLIQDLKPERAGPLALAAGAIAAVALLASYVPVRRATRVDPMEALRHD